MTSSGLFVGWPGRYLAHYFRTTARLLFHPGKFFSGMMPEGGIVLPLMFYLATHWLAAAISFFWKIPILKLFREGYRTGAELWSDFSNDFSEIDSPGRHLQSPLSAEEWFRLKEVVLPWFWGASSVLLDPFFAIFSLLFTASLMFIAARVLIDSAEPIRFRSILRIACFAGTPILWTVIPVAGALIAPIAIVATTGIAFVSVYQTSFSRGLLVALFPKFAFVFLLFGGVGILGWIAFRALMALFGLS